MKIEFSLFRSLLHLYSFVLSHPLCFFYLIFFSSYLFRFRVLSLFITTCLLLCFSLELREFKLMSFLVATYQTLVQRFRSCKVEELDDVEFQYFPELEVYYKMIVLKTSDEIDLEMGKNPDELLSRGLGVQTATPSSHEPKKCVQTFEGFLLENGPRAKENSITISKESKLVIDNKITISEARVDIENVEKDSFGSFDSNGWGTNDRKSFGEKEWKRTLACKLSEERSDDNGRGEEMDLLWERYEAEEVMSESDEHFCCLQAFKLSTGKMNLGMKTTNLVKITTKALKRIRIRWSHQVGRKHAKKGKRSLN